MRFEQHLTAEQRRWIVLLVKGDAAGGLLEFTMWFCSI